MKNAVSWKIVGGLAVTFGVLSVITGKSGLAFSEDLYGWRARTVGILMLFCGIKLIFPGIGKSPEK
jgi:hypothetical protein